MTNDHNTTNKPNPEKIRPGFLTYFVPDNFGKLPHILLETLSRNSRNYEVEIRRTSRSKLHFKAAISIPCLTARQKSQIRLISIDPSDSAPQHALKQLFATDENIILPPSKRILFIHRPENGTNILSESYSSTPIIDDDDYIMACATPFIGNEDYDNPDEDDEYNIESEQSEYMERLINITHEFAVKYHRFPSFKAIATAVAGRLTLPSQSEELSPITISSDLKIYLDSFDVELRMPPIIKSLFILFLRHSEGIILKEIYDYRIEILRIYALVKGHDKITKEDYIHINRLVDPFDNSSLNQKISKCRQLIDLHILNPEIARSYYIDGIRGERYRIPASKLKVTFPPSINKIKY